MVEIAFYIGTAPQKKITFKLVTWNTSLEQIAILLG